MPINQPNKDKNVPCISCGRTIAKGQIDKGRISIACKCGVINVIEAENKPVGRCDQPRFKGVVFVKTEPLKKIV